jgi:D-alanyl-D-alanine carboxypeptidase
LKIKNTLAKIIIVLLSAFLIFMIYIRAENKDVSPGAEQNLSATPSPTAGTSQQGQDTPVQTAEPTATPEPTPEPTPEGLPDIDLTEWQYILVNPDNPIGSDFVPEVTLTEGVQYFDSRAVDSLNDMIADARAQGLSVYLQSAYRNYATQNYLFNGKVSQKQDAGLGYEEAVEAAKRIVAYPGTSEHQTGLACDIVDKYYQYMNESLAKTELSKWLYAHCAEYGFIVRYPEDKQDITGVMYEPWHFRYVGEEAAQYIMEHGLCYEEFVSLYK